MTKSERLMHHLRVLQAKRVIQVEQLCQSCQVSPRTIYRDFSTLAKLGIPVYYDNGYRLERDLNLPLREFDNDDLELLGFCLRNNPLAEYPYFARRLHMIERRVLARLQRQTEPKRNALLRSSGEGAAMLRAEESRLIQRFLRAAAQSRWVCIRLKNSDRRELTCIPHALTLKDGKLYLAVSDSETSDSRELMLEQVREIRVSIRTAARESLQTVRDALSESKNSLVPSGS